MFLFAQQTNFTPLFRDTKSIADCAGLSRGNAANIIELLAPALCFFLLL